MQHLKRRTISWGLSFLIALLLLGCGPSEEEDRRSGWTIQEGALQLQEDLRISQGEDFYFGSINDVAVGKEGRLYVADAEAHHVKVLSPEGEIIDSIGTQGQGPGEFRRPNQVVLARGDSLYVASGGRDQISVFSPPHVFRYSFLGGTDRSYLLRLLVPEKRKGLLGVYHPKYRGRVEDPKIAVRPVQTDGTIGDTLFTTRIVREVSRDVGGTELRSPVPFSPHSHFAVGPGGRLYHGWGDSLKVTGYTPAGEQNEVVSIPFEPVPVTEKEIDEELESYPSELGGQAVSWDFLREKIPPTKPAFTQFLVDDAGRYWFGRPTPDPDSMAWWMAMPEKKRIVTDTLSSEVEILAVKDGHAYGRTTTKAGAPALVRYEVSLEDDVYDSR